MTGFSSSIYNDQLSQVLSGAIVDDKAVEALYGCEALIYSDVAAIPLYLESPVFCAGAQRERYRGSLFL